MSHFLKALAGKVPMAILAVFAAIALVFGSAWAMVPGLLLAGAVAAMRALDPARRRRARLTAAPGMTPDTLSDIERLEERLRALRMRPGVATSAQRALEQLDSMHERYLALVDILSQRFERTELTHGRYLEAGRQVYLSTLDNLSGAATDLETVAGIDLQGLRSELGQLERRESPSESERVTAESLRERVTLCEGALERAGTAIATNEQAANELAAATGALASIETRRGLADAASLDTMRELKALADRAEQYALPNRD